MAIKFDHSNNDFINELKRRVDQYFESNCIPKRGGKALYTKAIILLTSAVLLYGILLFPKPLWADALIAVLLGFNIALIGFNIMHDGSHGAFSEDKKLNVWATHTLECMGGDSVLWKAKHVVLHHSYVNTDEDDDVDYAGLLRILLSHVPRRLHRYQHIYAWFMYATLHIFWVFYFDIKKIIKMKIGRHQVKFTSREKWRFWLSKVSYAVAFIVIPILIKGWYGLYAYFIMEAVVGFTISIVFQLAHVTQSSTFQQGGSFIPMSLHEWHVRETCDFAQGSKALTWALGGLNFQIEHHLFPKISHIHYPKIAPIVRDVCKEFNIPYNVHTYMTGAIASHYKTLRDRPFA